MRGSEAFLIDDIFDYADDRPNAAHDYAMFGGSVKDEVDAALRTVSKNNLISGKMAMGFVVGIFHLNPTFNLGLTDIVQIEFPDAKVKKLKIATLEKFLTRTNSAAFQAKVQEWIKQGLTPYVAYEVYRAKSLKLHAVTGGDIAPSLNVDKVTPLPVSGELSVSYKKVATNRLEVSGSHIMPLPFAPLGSLSA